MNKFIAINISVVCVLATLILMSTVWVLVDLKGTLCYALSAAVSLTSGKSMYAYLKKKYRF